MLDNLTKSTRLIKTKQFSERLTVKRHKDEKSGNYIWIEPTLHSLPLDEAINKWVDTTGNEIINITAPSIFTEWVDNEKTIKSIIVSVMILYISAVK